MLDVLHFLSVKVKCLCQLHILCTRAFGATPLFVINPLPLLKLFNTYLDEGGVMEENVSAFAFDESKTLVPNQLLDRTLRHVETPVSLVVVCPDERPIRVRVRLDRGDVRVRFLPQLHHEFHEPSRRNAT